MILLFDYIHFNIKKQKNILSNINYTKKLNANFNVNKNKIKTHNSININHLYINKICLNSI